MNKLLFLAIMVCSITAFTQKSPFKFGDVPQEQLLMKRYEKDSSASAVILFDVGECSLDDQLTVTFKRHTRIKFFNKDAFDEWASESVYLDRTSESISKLKGATYNLENGKVVVSEMEETSVFKSKFNRYVDLTKFTLPNVKEGSIIEYSYTLRNNASLLPSWTFQHDIPAVLSQYETFIAKNFTFRKDLQGFLHAQHNVKNEGSNEIWFIADVPAFKEEPFITTPDDYVSKVNFYLSEVFIPGRPLINLTRSWSSIAKNLSDDADFGIQIRTSGYLKKTVEEITTGITDPLKKLQAIYDYVKKNVEWNETIDKIPDHTFKKVLEDKKGSSSEINLLLVSMLKKADLEAEAVLISTREHGAIRPYVPMFSQFDDVICVVKIGEKEMLIDGTDKHLSFTSLPKRCLNGEGLVVSKDYSSWIPLKTAKARTVIDADFKISNEGELSGKVNISRDGQDAGSMRKSYVELGEEKYVTKAFEGKPWEVGKSNFTNILNPNEAVKEVHELVIREHAQTGGSTIYVNPYILGQIEENPFKSDTREYPVDFSCPFDKFYLAKIQIPEDYEIEELPETKILMLPNGGGKFVYSVSRVGNTINFLSQLAINKSVFEKEDYPILREFYNQMIARQAQQIVLKKK